MSLSLTELQQLNNCRVFDGFIPSHFQKIERRYPAYAMSEHDYNKMFNAICENTTGRIAIMRKHVSEYKPWEHRPPRKSTKDIIQNTTLDHKERLIIGFENPMDASYAALLIDEFIPKFRR